MAPREGLEPPISHSSLWASYLDDLGMVPLQDRYPRLPPIWEVCASHSNDMVGAEGFEPIIVLLKRQKCLPLTPHSHVFDVIVFVPCDSWRKPTHTSQSLHQVV